MEFLLEFQQKGDGQKEKPSGYKLVPWLNWDEWNFVRESLFSSSPDSVAAALRRISAWRSRGCLPIVVEVTASIVEIQQKDPFFRGSMDDALDSDEMQAMLYCMAIMRLVNGLIEKTRKKTEVSIGEAADAIGIPRMLIDIRHEGSHRDLPSLQLVRHASMKALDWLKSYYWEPQKNAIPIQRNGVSVRKEIKSKLRELAFYISVRQAQQSSLSLIKGKRFKQSELLFGRTTFFSRMAGKLKSLKYGGYKQQITKTMRNLIRLYSSFPLEVVSVLLQFLLKSSDCSEGNEVDSYKSQVENDLGSLKPIQGTVNVWKLVIAKLSRKEPKFLLTMIKAVLEMIEAQETPSSGTGDHPLSLSLYNHQIEFLSSLVLWLIERLKELKNLRCRQSENGIPSEEADVIPIATLVEIIRKCLLILAPGNSLLTDSALILAEIIGNDSLVEQLKKLLLLRLPDFDFTDENSSSLDPENFLLQQEEFIVQAAAKLKLLKIQQKKSKMVNSTPINTGMEKKTNTWTLVKSWNPCPIGMLPHALSSSGVLPVLDSTNDHKVQDSLVGSFEEKENCELNRSIGKRDASCGVESLENTNAMKKMKQSVDDVGLDGQSDLSSGGITGRLLIDGFWKKVGEEELQAIGSAIRILV
ncbi:PREDICTED: uncharacterized protein LOC104607775 isoform X2 [Nelumbo nucifera]|uniref:Uncharacterized protein LOC104607775 isoform X2 n=1 Tax=Nelumbo nucifera TaxID=4432 RepID=A0A1U8AUK1_NELNU|nr:PREDICTED: uncharacterized protein LOC104607775 isoform X2 [Nelumbo nucifera]